MNKNEIIVIGILAITLVVLMFMVTDCQERHDELYARAKIGEFEPAPTPTPAK